MGQNLKLEGATYTYNIYTLYMWISQYGCPRNAPDPVFCHRKKLIISLPPSYSLPSPSPHHTMSTLSQDTSSLPVSSPPNSPTETQTDPPCHYFTHPDPFQIGTSAAGGFCKHGYALIVALSNPQDRDRIITEANRYISALTQAYGDWFLLVGGVMIRSVFLGCRRTFKMSHTPMPTSCVFIRLLREMLRAPLREMRTSTATIRYKKYIRNLLYAFCGALKIFPLPEHHFFLISAWQ